MSPDYPGVCTDKATDQSNNEGCTAIQEVSDKALGNTSTSRFWGKANRNAFYHYWSKDDDGVGLIKRGDVVQYDGHISIVHSERWGKQGDYGIIHASGKDRLTSVINGTPVLSDFNRKVVINNIDEKLQGSLFSPSGFGRIKLWD